MPQRRRDSDRVPAEERNKITVVTTDSVPGIDRLVAASNLVWSGNRSSLMEATEDIKECAFKNGMQAIVGVRVLQVASVYGGPRYIPTQTTVTYIMYGTAIRYRDQ
jgi:uncharacterized protein YbjQ (UPF0145 family)